MGAPQRVRRRILAMAVTGAAVVLAGCGGSGSGAADTEAVEVAFVPVATFLPAFVAAEAGIFERNDLDVRLTPIQNLSTIPGALGRQFDIGSSTSPDLIKAVGQGIEVTAVTGATTGTPENPIGAVVVPQDSPIRTARDLAGARVATPTVGAAMHVATLNWLAQEGQAITTLTAVEIPFANMLDQLRAGRVDAAEVVEPFLGLALDQGFRSIGTPIESSVGEPPVLSVLWIADRGWAQDNPELVERWTRSLVEAEELIAAEPTRARQILQEYTKLPPEVAESLQLPTYAGQSTADELQRGLAAWIPALDAAGQFAGAVPERLVAESAGSD